MRRRSIFLGLIFCSFILSLNLFSKDNAEPKRYYVESVDSAVFRDGAFILYYYNVWPAAFKPGEEIQIKCLRACERGVYFLKSDIKEVNDIQVYTPRSERDNRFDDEYNLDNYLDVYTGPKDDER